MQCPTCDASFDGTRVVCCPACLAKRWLATPNLVREKHDPHVDVTAHAEYRSVVTPRLIADLAAVLGHAAAHGAWFFDTGYQMLVHLTSVPLGRAPGAGIPAGRREPEHALDCLFIAEADSADQAHVFAVDGERHRAQVQAGVFEPLGECAEAACDNLALPRLAVCMVHWNQAASAWPTD